MQLFTIVFTGASLFGSTIAAPVTDAAGDYSWSGTKWSYGNGQSGDQYSLTVKGTKHDGVPKFKAVCTGTVDADDEDCSVTYDGPEIGEGSISMWTTMDIKTDKRGNTYPRVIIGQFYDNGITCGQTYYGKHVGPVLGGDTTDVFLTITPKEDFSC